MMNRQGVKDMNMKNKLALLLQWILLVLISALSIQAATAKERIRYHINGPDGSVLRTVDDKGVAVTIYRYSPFGEQLQQKKPANLKAQTGFVGGIHDQQDLVYLKQRYYNPTLGRFYQPDTVTFLQGGTGQINRYQYGWNDPYSFRDPSGATSEALQSLPAKWQQDIELFGLQLNERIHEGLLNFGITLGSAVVGPEVLFARGSASGSIMFYRTMSQQEFGILSATGKLAPSLKGETMISPTLNYAQKYNGITVAFEMKPIVFESLKSIGVRDSSKLVSRNPELSSLPIYQKGWMSNYALFKSEARGEVMSIGLGNGKGLNIFNQNIKSFRVISSQGAK